MPRQPPIDGDSGDIAALIEKVAALEAGLANQSITIAHLASDVAIAKRDADAALDICDTNTAAIINLTSRLLAVEQLLASKPWESTTPPPPTGTPETIWLGDYTNQKASLFTHASLSGKGRDLTTYRLRGSTQQAYVDSLVQGSMATNQLMAIRQGSLSSPGVSAATLAELTLNLSDVPHNTNGIQVAYVQSHTTRNDSYIPTAFGFFIVLNGQLAR